MADQPHKHPPTSALPSDRFKRVIERIDQLNREDPNTETVERARVSKELFYSQQLTAWVLRLHPGASEVLQIAARGQHIRRWTMPRTSYEPGRRGYLRWRERLKAFHIETVSGLMRDVGYPEEMIQRVQAIMGKRHLQDDPESQTLEDALCLVFLETQLEELMQKTSPETMREILRKTWKKMGEAGRTAALKLRYTPEARTLIEQVLSGG